MLASSRNRAGSLGEAAGVTAGAPELTPTTGVPAAPMSFMRHEQAVISHGSKPL
ncbi:MAG: hypothetical protein IPI02_01120 [Sterolibacteriaceae bacterium]|nr:hypothetical protein [Sterolibacteriaceae bacterium]